MKNILVILAVLLGFHRFVTAKTWNVPSEVPTIKIAVEDSAQYGDTVLVASGVYNTTSGEVFPINMKNGVVLISENGANSTIIDADSTRRVISSIDVDSLTVLSGFTIQNGCAGLNPLIDTTFVDSCGGGILCGSNCEIYIIDNILIHNFAFFGAAIYCDTSSFPKIISNLIKEHIIEYSGVINSRGSIILQYNTVTENTGSYPQNHSAIDCYQNFSGDTVSVYISENTISNNECMGVKCGNLSQVIVTQNVITNNWCGIQFISSDGIISKNMIMKNTGYSTGGGIRIWFDSSPIVERNIIIANTVSGEFEFGGGIQGKGGGSAIIRRNVIAYNIAKRGAAFFLESLSSPTIENNTIVGNISTVSVLNWTYAGVLRIRSYAEPQITANGFFDNFIALGNFTLQGEPYQQNNIYYNTYQPTDPEVINDNSATTINVDNNFWWSTDSASIDSLLWGNIEFMPFLNEPNRGAPCEPSDVYSVTVMRDSTYSTPLEEPLNIGDTLYIQLNGNTWNSLFIDVAMVILTSNKDPYGIGVAIIETDTTTGIYRGKAYIENISNDSWNKIGVNLQDTIIIYANTDTTRTDTVIVVESGIEMTDIEGKKPVVRLLQNYPNPFFSETIIRYSVVRETDLTLRIYDISGRLVKTLINRKQPSDYYTIKWDGKDAKDNEVKPGIYFLKATGCKPFKVVKLRR